MTRSLMAFTRGVASLAWPWWIWVGLLGLVNMVGPLFFLGSVEAKVVLNQIGGGMITKVHAAIEALSLGSGDVVIASGFVDHPLSGALQHKSGTVINNG